MKTILVVYSNTKAGVTRYAKRYAFITEADVKKGDVLKSNSYNTNMVVVKVLDEKFRYFNKVTGKLTNEFNNANLYKTRKIKLVDNDDDVIAIKV